jgi:hypothetical protein
VIAVVVYISFLKWHLVGTFSGYVLAHAALGVPFVLVSVTSALSGFDAKLLRASASLGAPPLRTFVRVTMPLISPTPRKAVRQRRKTGPSPTSERTMFFTRRSPSDERQRAPWSVQAHAKHARPVGHYVLTATASSY